MSGDPYIKENEELRDEIARLSREGVECAQKYQEAMDEIDRLQELLRGTGANRYWEGRWRNADAENQKLRAVLEDNTIQGAIYAALGTVRLDYRSPARLYSAAGIIADFVIPEIRKALEGK